jgi:hypothetical protein
MKLISTTLLSVFLVLSTSALPNDEFDVENHSFMASVDKAKCEIQWRVQGEREVCVLILRNRDDRSFPITAVITPGDFADSVEFGEIAPTSEAFVRTRYMRRLRQLTRYRSRIVREMRSVPGFDGIENRIELVMFFDGVEEDAFRVVRR